MMLNNDKERREYINNDANWETVRNMLDSRVIIDFLRYKNVDLYRILIKEDAYDFNTGKYSKTEYRCRCYLHDNGASKSFSEVGKTEIIGLLKDADLRDRNNG